MFGDNTVNANLFYNFLPKVAGPISILISLNYSLGHFRWIKNYRLPFVNIQLGQPMY